MSGISGRVLRSIFKFLFFTLLGASFFSGIITYLAVLLDYKVINLWKELLVFSAFLTSTFFIKKISEFRFILFYFIFLFIGSFYAVSIFFVKNELVAYQIKLDIVFLLTFCAWFFYYQSLSCEDEYRAQVVRRFVVFVIFGALLNSLFCIVEGLYPGTFLSALGIGDEDWGANSGVRVISTMGMIRAPGLLSGFVQSGVLLFIGVVLIFERFKAATAFAKAFKMASIVLILIGLYYSTYKNAQLGLIVYLVWRFSVFLLPSFRALISWAVPIVLGVFLGISTNGESLYWLWKLFGEKLAYNSIYLRIIFHEKILSQCLKSWHGFIFGVGAGINGAFGLDKTSLVANPIPTDSSFIYLFSNYGLVGVLLYLSLLFYSLDCAIKINDKACTFICIYFLSIDFFFNNMITNFPSNIIFAVLMSTAISRRLDFYRPTNRVAVRALFS